MRTTTLATLLVLAGCTGSLGEQDRNAEDPGAAVPDPSGGGGQAGDGPGPIEEAQPEPADGAGVQDPLSRSLHDHGCGGIDWQLVAGWLLLPHAAPEIAPTEETQRCVDRYAGWVTNEADSVGVSRASVYAALAAAGQCDADRDYDGSLVPGPLCTAVHTKLTEAECLAQMEASPSFGIATVASVLAAPEAVKAHDHDPPLMAALLASGAVACGGDDRWKLDAPADYVDRYVRAYNAQRALGGAVPACSKRLVLTVALYTGMDDPGGEGVTKANGCWTYERVSKSNTEWKICGYDGTVHHEDGVKWAYDDTNTSHDISLEQKRINDCKNGVPGRGYVYMANRGQGWPKRVTKGVRAHFAEIYSSQYTVDDQFGAWQDLGEPGQPMINVGQPSTTATHIHDSALKSCKRVADGGFLGIYVYPEALRTARMSALVKALNECTNQK